MPKTARFEDLTETTGIPLSREAAEMMYTRYRLAADLAAGKRVLELGCGAGQGFGLISRSAASVIGGDYSMALLRSGRSHYGARVSLVRLSADDLPFRERSFDLVLFFEASYYVPDMDRGFDEVARVLAPGGVVLLVNANPQRPDFIRSPHTVHYHTADEFRKELARRGFTVEVSGAFPVEASGGMGAQVARWVLSVTRTILERLGLVPRTLLGRARLKRLVHGKLRRLPAELEPGFATVADRVTLRPGVAAEYKVLYARGQKRGS